MDENATEFPSQHEASEANRISTKDYMSWRYAGLPDRTTPSPREVGMLFAAITGAEALNKNPRHWPGKRILDVSAHNGTVDLELARQLNAAIEQLVQLDQQDGHSIECASVPIEFFLNDIVYYSTAEELTEVGKRATTVAQQINALKYFMTKRIIGKNAAELSIADTNNQPVDIIIDRLGAVWHTIDNGFPELDQLIRKYNKLLSVNGIVILDDYSFISNRGDPHMSTGTKLRELLGYDQKRTTTFFRERGFEYVTSGAGSIETTIPATEQSFIDDRARILYLRKLPD